MAEHYAMIWKVRKGTEEQVRELFHNYGRPDHVIKDDDGNEIGLLVSTQVFMRENTIVRVIEADAPSFIDVGKHMRKQQAIQDLETKLDPFLEEPRDMSTPQGAAQFFMSTMMECLVVRRHDE